jgi:hypothetical protein
MVRTSGKSGSHASQKARSNDTLVVYPVYNISGGSSVGEHVSLCFRLDLRAAWIMLNITAGLHRVLWWVGAAGMSATAILED